jgi:hypothetical protein
MTHPTNKQQKKSRKGKSGRKGAPGSSDLAVAAGRGRNIPRANMGHDTLLGLAQSQRRTLVFAYANTLTTAAGAYIEATTITLNNLFSPNGGGSAVGFAKYMAFYSKAWVLGARLRTDAAIGPASTAPFRAALTITTNNTSLGSVPAAIENGMCDWILGAVNPDRHAFRQAVDIAKFLTKPRILDDPQLFCTASAGPTQLVVAHLGLEAGGSAGLFYLTEIEFDVVFTDPIPFT